MACILNFLFETRSFTHSLKRVWFCTQTGLWTLLPSVVDAVSAYKIPVIAAGGIVDGRGYVAALALGAQGVCMGTRYFDFLIVISSRFESECR